MGCSSDAAPVRYSRPFGGAGWQSMAPLQFGIECTADAVPVSMLCLGLGRQVVVTLYLIDERTMLGHWTAGPEPLVRIDVLHNAFS